MKKSLLNIFALSILYFNFSYSSLDDGLLPQVFDAIPLTCAATAKKLSKDNKLINVLDKIRHSYGIVNELFLSWSTASCKTQENINKILEELNYNNKIEIRRLHWLGRTFRGKNNIFITTAGNLIVSEDWFNNLTYDEQKFIIAQRISQLEDYHHIIRYIIRFTNNKVYSKKPVLMEINGRVFRVLKPENNFIVRLLWSALELSTRRKLSSLADSTAYKKLNTVNGAEKFFQRRLNYEHDGSAIGRAQMFVERIRDIFGKTALYYFYRANKLNEERVKNLSN